MLIRDTALAKKLSDRRTSDKFFVMNDLYDKNPHLYDHLYGALSHDLAFWEECARDAQGEVLELGVGTGRIAIPLALSGFNITGVDRSLPMLSLAKKKSIQFGVEFDLVREDIRALQLGKRFQLVIAPANLINECITARDIDLLLQTVKNHLSIGGKFIIDSRNRVSTEHTEMPKRLREMTLLNGSSVNLDWQRIPYSHETQLCVAKIQEDIDGNGTGEDFYLAHRIYFPEELYSLLIRHGFNVVSMNGSYDRSPLTKEGSSLLTTCVREI